MELEITVDAKFINKLSSDLDESQSDVIKDAVSILKWIVDEAKRGRLIVSTANDGTAVHRLSVKAVDNILKERGILL